MIAPQKEGGTKKMDINKKVLASVFIISMLAFSLGYGTYSYFSDTETSKGNTFTAGTLDLKVDGKDDPDVATYFELVDVAPGDSGCELIELSNAGSLKGKAWLKIVGVADAEHGLTEPELELGDTEPEGELCDNLYIVIWVEVGGEECVFDDNDIPVVAGFRSKIEDIVFPIVTINAKGSVTICFHWEIPSYVGNIIQSDYCAFNIVFGLEQA
jgi:predicted ribosomally synthesized peptide with SipW-like signal peptide